MNPYKTDEGSDVTPAVHHQWVWTITDHVRDIAIETASTFKEKENYY